MKVQFYISQLDKIRTCLFTCRLIEKFYREKTGLYLHTDSIEDANYFDKLLWTYKDDSFIPHALHTNNNGIIVGESTANHFSVIINFSKNFPQDFLPAEQIIEIVGSEPQLQSAARDRFKKYRELSAEILTTKITTDTLQIV